MKRILILISFFIALVAPLTLRSLISANSYLSKAEKLYKSDGLEEASDSYLKAIKWSIPLFSKEEIANTFFGNIVNSDLEANTKLNLLRELRSSLKTSRSFLTNSRTDQITHKIELEFSKYDQSAKRKDYLHDGKKYTPNYLMQLLSNLFFLGWILATMIFVKDNFSQDAKFIRLKSASKLRTVICFYLGWLLTLSIA
ncbi:MAG: hypothetical protein H6619_05460 [Deltaproteobacteria bacterium]|nr:hypothetical protein [Deltaproteobacteria bacterium]